MTKGLEKTCKFLKEENTYYLATIEDNKPRVRPFGTAHIFEDKLYIQTGLKKDVAKQMLENPNVEISGEAVLDERVEAQESLLNEYPELSSMYKAGDGNTAVFYLNNAKARFFSFSEAPEEFEI